jgi:thiol-disulfide isomerase/thioredoxin
MKARTFLKIWLLSLALSLIIAPLRSHYGGGFPVSTLIGFVLALYLTMFCIYRYEKHLNTGLILLALMIGLWFINIPIRVLDFSGTLLSLPDPLAHSLGIICGALYWRMKAPLNFAALVLCCIVPVYMYFQGYDQWISKLNYGTFTGKVEAYALPAKFEAFDEQKNIIDEDDLNGKIALLDFWYTGCGICFKKFPHVQAAYEKFKDDASVKIIAVDKPLEDDKPGEAFSMIRREGYTFPVVIAGDENLPENLGVKFYPTTFVIDRQGKIVYRGDIQGAVATVEELSGR